MAPVLDPQALSPVTVKFPAEGVFAFESRHARGFRMPDTRHDYWKILYVSSGKGCLFCGPRRHPLQSGDILLVPPQTLHRIEDAREGPLSLYAICLLPAVISQIKSAAPHLVRFRQFHRPPWGGEIKELLRRLLIDQARSAPGSGAFVTGLAWQILGWIWRAAHQQDPDSVSPKKFPKSQLARKRVELYCRELPLAFHDASDLDSAASRLGLSRRRFSQLFHETSGKSWLQAIQDLRIQYAQHLLTETSRSVAAVAFEAGFSDLTHFYRTFRRRSGRPPEAWRRAFQKR